MTAYIILCRPLDLIIITLFIGIINLNYACEFLLLINDLSITLLNKHTFKTILEPHIRTQLGLRKPDLLAYRNDIIYITDTQISTNTIDTDTNYRHKTDYLKYFHTLNNLLV